ncbi:hypothetical protein SAMN04488084_101339 [Pedobacter antarcticus]|nr:hypothetical protein SAMN04488084_101339 [Pedobacter antarcticus]
MLTFKHQMHNYFKKIHFIGRFFQSLCIPLLICSFFCCFTFWIYGAVTIPVICWFKIISTIIFILYSFNYQQQQLYYYYNLGASKLQLGAGVFILDMLIFIPTLLFLL